MKAIKFCFVAMFLILLGSNTLNAQWYTRSCDVLNVNECSSEEFECLWNKASKMSKTGAIVTIVGTSAIAGGGLLIGIAAGNGHAGFAWTGVTFIMGGILIDIIGLPVWIIGANRKYFLKNTPGYKDLNYAKLSISPIMLSDNINSSQIPGLSISLRF